MFEDKLLDWWMNDCHPARASLYVVETCSPNWLAQLVENYPPAIGLAHDSLKSTRMRALAAVIRPTQF